MRNRYFAAAVLLLLMSASAIAADQVAGLMEQFETATTNVNKSLIKTALMTAGAAVSLQWIASHWKEIFNNDLSSLFAKTIGCISWFGFSVYLINHQDMLSDAFNSYMKLATKVAGSAAGETVSLAPGDILWDGISIMLKTNWAIQKANFTGATSEYSGAIGEISKTLQNLNPFGAIVVTLMMLFADIFMFVCYIVIAASVFMARVEFWLMFSVAPLAISLISLQALRDQGIAPLKGLISVGLRLVILGVITGVTNAYSKNLIVLLDKGLPADEYLFVPVWSFMGGLCICAIVAGYAGKIASSIASGSASFSGADVIGGAGKIAATAAVGTAAVAAVATGGGAAIGAMAGAGKSAMSGLKTGLDMLNKFSGAAGSSGGAGGGEGSAFDKAMKDFGGPAIQQRPTGEASAGKTPAAGIGGTGGQSGTAQSLDKLANNAHKAGQGDAAATEIKINLGGGD